MVDESLVAVRATEFRRDGWPLCPVCGEDELYTLTFPEKPLETTLTKRAAIETICGCYRCGPLRLESHG